MVLLNAKFANEHTFKTLPNFSLEDTNHCTINDNDIVGENGLLVMFICNHCPYVKAIIDNIIEDDNDLQKIGINSIAINSNDPEDYPEDSFENMIEFVKNHGIKFPYVIDKTQEVAKKFGAVCTPDFFLFTRESKGDLVLSHKGRLNDFVYTKNGSATSNGLSVQRELYIIAQYLVGKARSAMGCSIKWRD